jgi:hypothetical protein
MPMIDLGHEYPSASLAEEQKAPESRKDYPCIYLRGDQVLKDPPKGRFFALVEMRVAGLRDPSDGEPTMDLETLRMSTPVSEAHAKSMLDDAYGDEDGDSFSSETATKAFRSTMKDIVKSEQIGQSH